jgi:predicted acetyltransferase
VRARLVLPEDEAHWPSFCDAARELAAEGTNLDVPATFAELRARYEAYRAGRDLPRGHVPSTELWLVDGEVYLGRVSIRHALTEHLRRIGGHIGYVIRPSRRREGHGTRILQLALPHAHALGIDPALVTCDSDNIASRKIIEAAGGVLDTSIDVDKLRFWVATGSARDSGGDDVRRSV